MDEKTTWVLSVPFICIYSSGGGKKHICNGHGDIHLGNICQKPHCLWAWECVRYYFQKEKVRDVLKDG